MNCNMNYKYFKGLNCKQVNVQSFHENQGNNFYYKVETDKLSTVTQGTVCTEVCQISDCFLFFYFVKINIVIFCNLSLFIID